MKNTIKNKQLKTAIVSGLNKGWSGFIWMLKIIVPISFLTALLVWSGWMGLIELVFQPIMNSFSLPAIAALPLIMGMLTGIYGGIASMAVLPLTLEEMTLIAIFLLIAHNLIQEGIIQGKSGVNFFKATLFRLVIAAVTVFIAAQFLDVTSASQMTVDGLQPHVSQPFLKMLRNWGIITFHLIIKIFFIIMFILTLLEILKSLGWITHIVRFLSPVLKIMGLNQRVGLLWVTAVVFGLAYGGAVIVEEAKNGQLSREELEELHLSIGINHSMIEDPCLFLPLGISAFWLWIPRLIIAIIAVRLLVFWQIFREKHLS